MQHIEDRNATLFPFGISTKNLESSKNYRENFSKQMSKIDLNISWQPTETAQLTKKNSFPLR